MSDSLRKVLNVKHGEVYSVVNPFTDERILAMCVISQTATKVSRGTSEEYIFPKSVTFIPVRNISEMDLSECVVETRRYFVHVNGKTKRLDPREVI